MYFYKGCFYLMGFFFLLLKLIYFPKQVVIKNLGEVVRSSAYWGTCV